MSLAAAAPVIRPKYLRDNLIAALLGWDGLLLLLSRVIQAGNGFVLSVILLKEFGLARVGTYTIATAASSALSLLCSVGLQYSLPRESLSEGERNTVAVCWAFLMIPLVVAAAIPFGWLMAQRPSEWLEIALFTSGGYFFAQTNVLNMLLLLQRRARWMIVPPLTYTGGMIAGVLLGGSVARFASILLFTRALGAVWLFTGMKYGRVKFASILRYGLRGLKYSPMDLIAMLSEQASPLIMARVVTRAELGIYGLCLQVLTTADVPGWSVVQSHYPELVRTRLKTASGVKVQVVRLSFLVAFLVFVAAAILGRYVYRVPRFWLMMALLALSLPLRYLNNFYDQILRAAGCVGADTWLAAVKCLLALILFWSFGSLLGLWGGIIGLMLLSVASAGLYARKALPIMGTGK